MVSLSLIQDNMKQEIIIDINISTAVYLQIYFLKYKQYPLIFSASQSYDNYFPTMASEEIYQLLIKLFSWVEKYFVRYNVQLVGKNKLYDKYIVLEWIKDFFYLFFQERTEVFLYDTIKLDSKIWKLKTIHFFQNNVIKTIDGDFSVVSWGNKLLLNKNISVINTDKIMEIYNISTVIDYVGKYNYIYELLIENWCLCIIWHINGKLFIWIEYSSDNRDEAIKHWISFFSQYLPHTNIDSIIKENKYQLIPIKISLNKSKFSNVKLLWNGLGYLPPLYNFGLLFSICDAFNTLYYSHKYVIYYRIKLYLILKFLHKKNEKFNESILLSKFLSREWFNLSVIKSKLNI